MEKPKELWLLRHADRDEYVRAIDGDGHVCMAIMDEAEAILEAVRQNELYDLNCVPERFVVIPSDD